MKTLLKIISLFVLSVIISFKPSILNTCIISYDFVLNSLISLFSVSLAIVAIFFTVLDRYKENIVNREHFLRDTNAILKEMAENSLGLFILIIILFIESLFHNLLSSIQLLNIPIIILIFCLSMSLLIVFDIAFSILILINKLNDFTDVNDDNFGLTQDERKIIELIRKLDKQSRDELKEYLKALFIKQNMK